MALTAIRGKDWAFQALYAACGVGGKESADSSVGCALEIPVTFIFQNGLPVKTLCTDASSGRLKRINLENVNLDASDSHRGFRGHSLAPLRAMMKVLHDYALQNDFESHQINLKDINIAKVFYVDDLIEDLSAKSLELLLRNDTWRAQVLLIQGYVPILSVQTGLFSQQPVVRSRLDPMATVAADNFARSIVKYIERAYLVNSQQLFAQSSNTTIPDRGVSLKVDNMQCKFGLDPHNKVIFLYAEYTAVMIENHRREVEEMLRTEKNGRELSAAEQVHQELIQLLTQAQHRGLGLESSFKHFDVDNLGFVDTDRLIDGLARLGIGVTYPVGENVLQMIGGVSASFFTYGDFERHLNAYFGDFDATKVMEEADRTRTNQATRERTKQHKEKTLKELRPPVKVNTAKVSLDISQSQELPSLDDDVTDYEKLPLPLPEEMYTTHNNSTTTQRHAAVPRWASERSKRALRQMSTSASTSKLATTAAAPVSSPSSNRARSRSPSRASKRSKVGGSSNNNSTRNSMMSLDLQSISLQESMVLDSANNPDELLHIEQGVIMSYRILDGAEIQRSYIRTKEKQDDLRYRSIMSAREKDILKSDSMKPDDQRLVPPPVAAAADAGSSGASAAAGVNTGTTESLTLLVIPDITMTLDTLQHYLEPLIHFHPMLRVVLVGLIGLPNTVWPKSWILNSDLHAKCIAHLVNHLYSNQRLFFIPPALTAEEVHCRLIPIGFGLGAFHLCRFVAQHSLNLAPQVSQAMKSIVLINGILKINKAFRKICRELRDALMKANVFEANELITSLHFSDQFLSRNQREATLAKFWLTRKTLRAKQESVLEEALSSTGGLDFIGLLDQLRGVISTVDEFDGALLLTQSNLPIAVVQCTEDVFIDPKSASVYSPMQLPPERVLVTDVNGLLNPMTVFMTWLKAGHEVIQERTSFILSLLSSLAKLFGLESPPTITADDHNQTNKKTKKVKEQNAELDDLFDVLQMGRNDGYDSNEEKEDEYALDDNAHLDINLHHHHTAATTAASLHGEDRDHHSAVQAWSSHTTTANSTAHDLNQQQHDHHTTDDNHSQASSTTGGAISLEEKQAVALEKMRRAQFNMERRKRQLRQSRQNQLEILYLREQEENDRNNERRELKIMWKEDKRSKYAAEYAIECEIAAISQQIAKEKSKHLRKLRREEAIKRVEDDLARKRSERIETRRMQAAALVIKIQNEELTLQGMKDGGYDLPPSNNTANMNVNLIIESSHRIMRDLFECRQKYIDAIKRQQVMQEKNNLFKTQLLTIENEERRLRRAIRLIEVNPMIVGNEMNPETQLSELRSAVHAKQETLNEMTSITKQRDAQLHASNRSVQLLKLASKERDVLMKNRLQELYKLETTLSTRVKELKMEKESMTYKRDKLRIDMLTYTKRYDDVNRELIRTRDHKGKLIDTDVWIEGVMQRCLTKELRKHLKGELSKAETIKNECTLQVESMRDKIFDISDIIALVKRDCDKITATIKVLYKTYQKFNATSVDYVASNLINLQAKAEKIELKKVKEANLEKSIISGNSDTQQTNALLDKVRLKESEIRTKDERQFVGIDLVLHPTEYLHLSTVEAEQMQFDEDYQCQLAKSDLERILKLPEAINLALPFLHTVEEVNAHRLINMFYRQKDESYFMNKDYLSHPNDHHHRNNQSHHGSTTGDNHSLLGGTTDHSSLGGQSSHIKGDLMSLVSIRDMQEAEVVHDILVKESLRDRLRHAFTDEKLTEEELKWIEIDKILDPHVYGEDNDFFETHAHAVENPSNADHRSDLEIVQSLTTSLMRNADNTHIVDTSLKQKANVESKEGDVYQPLRDRYDNDEDDLFGYNWHCPFNKQQLLHIHKTAKQEIIDPKQLEVKVLLDKYYVSDEESILGHAKLISMSEANGKLIASLQRIDRLAVVEIDANHRQQQTVSAAAASATEAESKAADNTQQREAKAATAPSVEFNLAKTLLSSHHTNAQNTARSQQSVISDNISSVPDETDFELRRIWGSWSHVHPASQGKESQKAYFQRSTFDATRDHPGCYALRVDEEDSSDSDADDAGDDDHEAATMLSQSHRSQRILMSPRSQGLKTLQDEAGTATHTQPSVHHHSNKHKHHHHHHHETHFIVDSIPDLATQEAKHIRGKIVLLQQPDTMQLFEVKEATINSRQSRSHYFQIPDRDNARVLDLTVSVVFQGSFNTVGYKLGRLAAGLFRLPPPPPDTTRKTARTAVGGYEEDQQQQSQQHGYEGSLPIPIGYSPHSSITPNLPTSMGRIVIFHKPKHRPLTPGTFQIVIGAASTSKYSIVVSGKYAKTALPIIDEQILAAKAMQARLPICLKEMDTIAESLRLAERKMLVCEKMIVEAEVETERCQSGMKLVSNKLEIDDEELTLLEDERRDLQRELGILEVEYGQWSTLFASRVREKEDIKEGMNMMHKFRRRREEEKAKIQQSLEDGRRDLPACIRLLRTMTEAVNVAMSLNTTLQGVSEETGAATQGDFGGIRVSTPAEDIRRALKQHGFNSLQLEEQQWCLLDQVLYPHKYDWLREQEEKERQNRIAMGKSPQNKYHLNNPALEPYKLSKSEIEYILQTPFSALNRREVVIRKLLMKYHDDQDFMKKALAAVAYAFDPHLAERTRAKNFHVFTKEEKEWMSIDIKLHPEIWKFYVKRNENFLDRHKKEAHINPNSSVSRSKGTKSAASTATKNKTNNTLTMTSDTASTQGTATNNTQADQINLDSNDFAAVVARMQQAAAIRLRTQQVTGNTENPNLPWTCQFTRDEILKIWKTPRHFLKTEDEKRTYRLLMKFNGNFTTYHDLQTQATKRRLQQSQGGQRIKWDKLGKLVSEDVDYRARQVMREIDRAAHTKNEFIQSDVLHANDQRFPTKVLRVHLEDELDRILAEQIKDRERADKIRVDSSSDNDDDDTPPHVTLQHVTLQHHDPQHHTGTPQHSSSQEEKEPPLYVDGYEDDVNQTRDSKILTKIHKRAQRRLQRKHALLNKKHQTLESQVMATKRVLKAKATKIMADLVLESQFGFGACLACRTKQCQWQTSIDLEACLMRKKELDDEIERIRIDRHNTVFSSDICLSAQLGGNRIFKREDLYDELQNELRELQLYMDLDHIDRELHDAYASRKEFFESHHLHGYAVLMWTNNARKALEQRHTHLVGIIVAKEVVDDILSDMLEGWVFGQRQSDFRAVGYVPTIAIQGNDGKIRAGSQQISSVMQVVAKMRLRAEQRKLGLQTEEMRRGQMMEKAYEIELQTQSRKERLKVAREGTEHAHLLNETEQTLRFGLFMMTLMYFRAMTFLRREQRSWEAADEEIGPSLSNHNKSQKNVKKLTDERLKMIDEENKARIRQKKIDLILAKVKIGEARRHEREQQERRDAILRLQTIIRRQRLELHAIGIIQKIYRGHLGRKAAKRWALKRAELGAMNALLNATAICIQRYYRGYRARVFTIYKRMEMAQFIALMRVQESAQDEDVYWQTHPWSRFKRRQRDWMHAKLEKLRGNDALGGNNRLDPDEEAALQGRTLDDIRREVEGLDQLDNEDLADVVAAVVGPAIARPIGNNNNNNNNSSSRSLASRSSFASSMRSEMDTFAEDDENDG